MLTMAAALMLTMARSEEPLEQPLTPSDKWSLDRGKFACTLARSFAGDASGQKGVTLAFRSTTSSNLFRVLLLRPEPSGVPLRSAITISFGDGESVETTSENFDSTERPWRMTRFNLDIAQIGKVESTMILRLTPSKGKPLALALSSFPTAWTALAACQASMMREWGVDPAENRKVAQPAVSAGDEANWIRYEDYPRSALAAGLQGTARMFFTIGVSGRITECRILESSGVEELDRAGCAAIMKRGRYTPAKDAAGQPMVTHKVRAVTWGSDDIWQTDAAYRHAAEKEMEEWRERHDAK